MSLLKSELRQSMKARLSALDPEEYQQLSATLRERFFQLPVVQNAMKIMIYMSVRHEVETGAIIMELLKSGKLVALPVCIPEKNLKAGVIKDLSELVPAGFGLREPPRTAPVIEPGLLDLIVVPGVAFDEKGERLGHGAGYYDRFLARAPGVYKLGLAYDFQVLRELPVDIYDLPMSGLLTPTRYLEF